MRRSPLLLLALALTLGVPAGAPAQDQVTPVKRCGKISDPRASGRVPVDIAEGQRVACTTARTVMRRYLSRVKPPRIPGSNKTVRIAGRRWSCYVSRSVGNGPGWDFVCITRGDAYTAVGGGLRQ
jgi:hypothetical protein